MNTTTAEINKIVAERIATAYTFPCHLCETKFDVRSDTYVETPYLTVWEKFPEGELQLYCCLECANEEGWIYDITIKNPCKCHDGMDIRGRCDPIRDAKQFSMCPARVDTTYFCIMNDCDKYQDIWSSVSREEKHKKLFEYARAEPFLLKDDITHSDSVLEEMLFLLFDEDDEEDEEDYESANCEKCSENYLIDKLEVKDDKFYCRVCFEEEDE